MNNYCQIDSSQGYSRRFKLLKIPPEMLLGSLNAENFKNKRCMITNLPDEIVIFGVDWDFETRCFMFLAWHHTFDICEFGDKIPELLLEVSDIRLLSRRSFVV